MTEKLDKLNNRKDWMSPEERVEFYLNNQKKIELNLDEFEIVKNENYWNQREMRLVSYRDFENTFTHWYCKHLVHLPKIRNLRVLPFYRTYKDLHSLMNFFHPFDRLGMDEVFKDSKYPLFYGEAGKTGHVQVIRKSRRSDDATSIIYNFRTLRLTLPCHVALKADNPWQKKADHVIWRGATTGQEQRVKLVDKYFDKYDIGFASVKQKPQLKGFKRNKVSIKDQLKYKFIISLEGNDVASNLRWILASNSVPIMKKPYWQSWIMEEKLKPNVHYLELNEDLSNLEEILSWAAINDDYCNEIAQNGKNYMSQFLVEKNDLPVQKLLLEEFTKRVSYIN
ncbi:glycosyl transferase family 90 [Ekhidna sp.]